MGSTTLVTGATGFIGSHLTRQLLAAGQHVRVLVRHPDRLANVGLVVETFPRLDVVQGDLLDRQAIRPALEGVDQLYHVAGYISTDPVERERVYLLNDDITRHLFEACRHADVSKVIYLASIFALGGGGDTPADETAPFDLGHLPIDYFKAKRKAEMYARGIAEDGFPLVFAYPCFCYGPGDVYVSSSRLVLAYLRRRLPCYIRGGQNYMDVRDAATGLILTMQKGRVGERYLLGGQNQSYEEIFATLSDITGYPPPKIKLPRGLGVAAGRVMEVLFRRPALTRQAALIMGHYWYYDDSKARKELGHCSRPGPETLEASVRWFCENGLAQTPPAMRA